MRPARPGCSVVAVKRPAALDWLRSGVDRWGDIALAAALTLFVQASIWTDDGYLSGSQAFFAFTSLLMTAPSEAEVSASSSEIPPFMMPMY